MYGYTSIAQFDSIIYVWHHNLWSISWRQIGKKLPSWPDKEKVYGAASVKGGTGRLLNGLGKGTGVPRHLPMMHLPTLWLSQEGSVRSQLSPHQWLSTGQGWPLASPLHLHAIRGRPWAIKGEVSMGWMIAKLSICWRTLCLVLSEHWTHFMQWSKSVEGYLCGFNTCPYAAH